MLLPRLSRLIARSHLCVPDIVICSPCMGGSGLLLLLPPLLLTHTHVNHTNTAHSTSFTLNTFKIAHTNIAHSTHASIANISSHTQSTHSIHSTHLTHLSLSHIISFNVFLILLNPPLSLQSPTHTLHSTLAYSFLDSQFGKTSYVGLSGPLIASNVGSNWSFLPVLRLTPSR